MSESVCWGGSAIWTARALYAAAVAQAAHDVLVDNHEILVHYRARTREEIRTESLLRNPEFVPQAKDRHVVGLADTSMRRHPAVVG